MRPTDNSHRSRVVAGQQTKERDYWLRRLSDLPERTAFPYDRRPGDEDEMDMEVHTFALPDSLADRLLQISNDSDSRLHMILTAGLAVLLSRYTGGDDILFGSPTMKQEVEAKFINTVLILRHRPAEDMTFKTLLMQVKETLAEAAEHVNYPLETLLYKLDLPFDPERFPLFDVGLLLENIHDRTYIQHIPLNLLFSFKRGESGLTCALEYNPSYYTEGAVQRIAAHLIHVLEQSVFNVDIPLAEIELVSEAESRLLLRLSRGEERAVPEGTTLHGLFEAQAALTPGAAAVLARGERITYNQLNENADNLAARLTEKGVVSETVVALMLEPSPRMIAAILAVLKAGGAYLPIDPAYPRHRIRYMLENSGAEFLVTEGNRLSELSEGSGVKEIIDLDELFDTSTSFSTQHSTPNTQHLSSAGPSGLAYIIYTSGTTGRPKGVAVEHRNVVNMLMCRRELYGMDENHTALNVFSYSFDGFITSCFTPLISGAAVVLLSESEVKDIEAVKSAVGEYRISHMICVPPLFKTIVQYLSPEELAPLKVVTLAGDGIPAGLTAEAREKNPGMEIVNEYGVTEGAVMSTIYRHQERNDRILIGRPIWNTRIHILDGRGALQPIGVPGELCIAGAGVAREYVGGEAPSLNRSYKSHRTYYTGDLARRLPDGDIEFLGRIDQQVKIRGFRIEPGEIESRLTRHPNIEEAVVIARENKQHDKYLCAYYVEDENKPPEWWPSVAEFFVYDELLYYAMTHDERRNNSYKVAINRLVKDKVVVEVGTGQDAILTRFCAEAGAKKIYAIELLEESYLKAKENIRLAGFEDRVHLIHGDATKVELPEKVDVCVSEIVGAIGGSEGAAVILNNARRFLKDDGIMIPIKSVTKIAAVTLPDTVHEHPRMFGTPANYTAKIFGHFNRSFDLRMCLRNLSSSAVISDSGVFEELDFSGPTPEETVDPIRLVIEKDSRMDGFLVWLNLHTVEGEVIDILEYEYCWLPVFAPVFYPGVDVSPGDTVEAECIRTLCENNVNPDFKIKGVLKRRGREDVVFNYDMPHFEKRHKSNAFYRELFSDPLSVEDTVGGPLSVRELSEYLHRDLPGFMIPAHFIPVDRIPLTANGKVDRKALPEPGEGAGGDQYTPPRNETEKNLTEIWREVLGVEKIGITDNFFMSGGDSIKAIQISARLKKYGLDLKIDDLFLNPTIKELAEHVKKSERTAHQGPVTGGVPLTPIQHWFFRRDFTDPHHFNQSVMLHRAEGFDETLVEKVFQKLLHHHDALRLVFKTEGGAVSQRNRGIEYEAGELFHFEMFDLRDSGDVGEAIEREAQRIQGSINLETGPLVKSGLFKTAEGDHLLIVIHHLVVDGVSWRILLEDFGAAYRQLQRGETVQLPPKSDAFKHWSEALNTHASTLAVEKSREFRRRLDYWKHVENTTVPPLPRGRNVPPGKNKTEYAETVSLELDETETETLLKNVNQAYNTEINDILLTALGLALSDWTGGSRALIQLEGHGREALVENVDISRTVGWFTSQFPFLLDVGGDGSLSRTLIGVKEALRRLPDRGAGYGVFKYLAPEKDKAGVSFDLKPEISFNYLGQFLQETHRESGAAVFEGSGHATGDPVSPAVEIIYPLDVRGIIMAGRLKLSFVYNPHRFDTVDMDALGRGCKKHLLEIIRHCSGKEDTQRTAGDFSASDLDQEEMEDIFDELDDE